MDASECWDVWRWLQLQDDTRENERLVADSCDESDEGSIGLSGEVLPSGFPGQELIEFVLPVCGWLVSECRMCMVLD